MQEIRSERAAGEVFLQSDDAIFALATVPDSSAVAIFRCSGTEVWCYLAPCFSRYQVLLQAAGHTAVYGFLCCPETGELVDEVLLLKFCSPRTYSGEDMLEIHCHGAISVLNAVRKLLLEVGLREAERGEFTYRSIRHGKRNLHQAEAIALLAKSKSQNERRSALGQLNSNFIQSIREIRRELLQVSARLELQLDYDESELEFSYEVSDSFSSVQQNLHLLQDSLVAYRLRQDCEKAKRVVLVGATNSGKSSLFNRLLLRERSIVSHEAGTTRDYVETQIELHGQNILLYDTAGFRHHSQDSIEQEGIRRTWQLLQQADFVLLLSDIRIALLDLCDGDKAILTTEVRDYLVEEGRMFSSEPGELGVHRKKLQELAVQLGIPLLEVWNKSDLLPLEFGDLCELEVLLRQRVGQEVREGLQIPSTCFEQAKYGQGRSKEDTAGQGTTGENPSEEPGANYPVFLCSAQSGQGLSGLIEGMECRLPQYPLAEESEGPVSERQAKLLQDAATLLQEYCQGVVDREYKLFDLDWACELLRQACGRLGEVSGEACNSQMLREIFQQFCVGK